MGGPVASLAKLKDVQIPRVWIHGSGRNYTLVVN